MKSLNKLCIGFYGTSDFSLSFLKELFSQDIKISYIVTKPPIPSGRGKKVKISPVHEWGLINKIDVLTPADMKDKKFLDYVKKRKIDFNIIVAYGNILTKEIINIPDYMSINVHASLLPRWRGAAPIQRAILSDDKETGVCIMRLDEKLDSGPIITLQKIVIEDDDNCENLCKKIVFFGKKILRDAIFKILGFTKVIGFDFPSSLRSITTILLLIPTWGAAKPMPFPEATKVSNMFFTTLFRSSSKASTFVDLYFNLLSGIINISKTLIKFYYDNY